MKLEKNLVICIVNQNRSFVIGKIYIFKYLSMFNFQCQFL